MESLLVFNFYLNPSWDSNNLVIHFQKVFKIVTKMLVGTFLTAFHALSKEICH